MDSLVQDFRSLLKDDEIIKESVWLGGDFIEDTLSLLEFQVARFEFFLLLLAAVALGG